MCAVPTVSACTESKRNAMVISLLLPRCDAHKLRIDETVGSRMVFSLLFLPVFFISHSFLESSPSLCLPLLLSLRVSLERNIDLSVKSYACNFSHYNFKMYLNNINDSMTA